MHELLITLGDGSVRVLPLGATSVTLGRDPNCELAFPSDAELSRRHLVFEPADHTWIIRDLNSTNGTRCNGEPVRAPRVLQPGDTVSASQLKLLFRRTGEDRKSTVVFDAAREEINPSGTVSLQLEDLLQQSTEQRRQLESGQLWVTPLQALLRVGRELAARRPLDELFPVVLKLALEGVGAERGVLLVQEGGHLADKASHGGEFRISTAVRDRVLTRRESLLIESVAESPSLQGSKTIMMQGVRSLMAVPLQTDEQVIGLLYVDARSYLRRFTNDDLGLLTVMANVAAIRIERQRLAEIEEAQRKHQLELEQAAEIQRRALPQAPPVWAALEVARLHKPCLTVGGDYHDYFQLADGRNAWLVADVAGKGMPAALMMMSLQARAQAISETCSGMADFVTRLNRSMLQSCAPNRFVTMFACAFGASTGQLHYTNAGHLPGLLIRAAGEVLELTTGGMFVGLLPSLTYDEGAVAMDVGDLLVLYSDGITEQENKAGEEFGIHPLAALVTPLRHRPLAEIVQRIEEAVSVWSAGVPVSDDQTLVLVRRKPADAVTRRAPLQ